jgi:pimeloyl-ACP methyl ester carboxylesterase
MFCTCQTTSKLADHLALHASVINYDRRGRGGSGDTTPYDVQREVDDLAALIAEAGTGAALCGHSSGAGLALRAAASGLPITRLVLHEPPYGPDDEDSVREALELAARVRAAIEVCRYAEAIALFLTASGMPPEMAEDLSDDPGMRGVAPTMPYDFEVMGDAERGGTIPEELVRAIAVPTMVIAGGASPTSSGTPPPASRRYSRTAARSRCRARTTAHRRAWWRQWWPSSCRRPGEPARCGRSDARRTPTGSTLETAWLAEELGAAVRPLPGTRPVVEDLGPEGLLLG